MAKLESNGSWEEYAKLVLAELERLDGWLGDLSKSIPEEFKSVRKEISDKAEDINRAVSSMNVRTTSELRALQVKAGTWGLLGGLIPVLIAILIMVMKSKGGP